MRIIACMAVLLLAVVSASTEEIFEGQIGVKSVVVRRVGDSVNVAMEFDCRDLQLPSNRSLLLTPVVVGVSGRKASMKGLALHGHQYHKAYLRAAGLQGRRRASGVYATIDFTQDTRRVYRYRQSLAFAEWMRGGRLEVVSDLCGCGVDAGRVLAETVVSGILTEKGVAKRARRAQVGEVTLVLTFPWARADILPFFGNNARELAKVEALVRRMQDDRNVEITNMAVRGYASPEGNADFNRRLSWRRAEAVAAYLSCHTYLSPQMVRIGQCGEDWEGLAQRVRNSYIQPKERILWIIRNYGPNERKQRLKALGGGAVEQRMRRELYPLLRRVVCRIEYRTH